ncbi:MAG: TylF/MycF/NovP-related O-methyltransferase [Acidobacteriota bacterium]|nr:TylF/MycF/NovP-related O-methyltransferase [Acidobacteriota bacterium]
MFKRRAQRVLWRVLPLIQFVRYGRPNPIEPWDSDDAFREVMERVQDHTVVDKVRCYMLWQWLRTVLPLEGDVAEVGVYRGGTARLLGEALGDSGKTLHLFDTFCGMPETDPQRDYHERGEFDDTSLDAVRAFLQGLDRVAFHPGRFPASATTVRESRFCFVHVDVDIYRSVFDCCSFFYPRLTSGGLLVFDDYGFVTCPGAKEAVDEFFAGTRDVPCYLPTGQCVVRKH